jgi:HK97 family phage major capsid protein
MSGETSMVALTRTINQIGEAFEEFKKTNDDRLEAAKKGKDSLAAELDAKLDKVNASLAEAIKTKKDIETEVELQRERIEELESRASSPGKTVEQKAKDEYKSAFINWLRAKGSSPIDEQKMVDLQRKGVIIATPSAGGYAVPEEIAREIERLEKKFSPVRDLVKVVQTTTSDYKELVNIRGATSGWVGESTSRPETNTPALREVVPTHGELYAYPQVSEWALDDMFFNVEAWLAEEVAQEFAIQEGDAVIRGNGSSKPTGMLNTAPTSRDDFDSPIRAAAAYQYVDDGDSPYTIGGDTLISAVYKLNTRYRSQGRWAMNSATTGVVRKLKDSQNQYLWAPGLANGQPDSLLGYPVATWEDMDDVDVSGGSDAKYPIAFGDFRRAYVLTDRVGMRITRDNVTSIGFVKFYIRRREGGIVLNNDALKWIKTAA